MELIDLYSDDKLIDGLAIGDSDSFEVIYRKYAKDLYRYARMNIDVKEDCEEIIQDIFIDLWSRRETINVASLRHYLFTSVRYKIIRYFKHKGVVRRFEKHYLLFEAAYDTIKEEGSGPEILQEQLLSCIATLPDRCQEAMKMRILENLSNSEIAERMNITKKAVEKHMHNALKHLRATFPKMYKIS
jgi:RNA polymerase sigma-70 factor (family 1)